MSLKDSKRNFRVQPTKKPADGDRPARLGGVTRLSAILMPRSGAGFNHGVSPTSANSRACLTARPFASSTLPCEYSHSPFHHS